MSTGLSVTPEDRHYFSNLPLTVKMDVLRWQKVLSAICRAKHKSSEIRNQAFLMKGIRGFSRRNIIRKYYEIVNGGDWRGLINHSRIGHKQETTEKFNQ